MATWFSPALALLSVLVVMVLVLVQADRISRRRIVGALVFVLVVVGCRVYADGDIVIVNPCTGLEPYSFLWWLLGCWGL